MYLPLTLDSRVNLGGVPSVQHRICAVLLRVVHKVVAQDGNIAMMLSNEEDRELYMEWTVSMAPPFSDAAKIAIREAADEYWAEQDRRGTD